MERDFSKYSTHDFERGASPIKEWLWYTFRTLFFMHSFPLPSEIKVWVLRWFGAQIGQRCVIRSHVNISFPWRLKLGDHVWLGDEVGILSLESVTIGSNVCISQRTYLCTGSHDYKSEAFDLIVKPIQIEAGCWVGACSFIGPGVVIKRNSVCAAGSIVIKSMGPNVVVAGNPARIVRNIFE